MNKLKIKMSSGLNNAAFLTKKNLHYFENASEFDLERDNNLVKVESNMQLWRLAELQPHYGVGRFLIPSKKEEILQNLLNQYSSQLELFKSSKKCYIFGTQRLGQDFLSMCQQKDIEVLGFVDNDKSKWGQIIKGKQVFSPDDILSKSSIIVIATTKFLTDISRQLIKSEFKTFIPYPVLSYSDPYYKGEIPYIGVFEDLAQNAVKYINLYLRLSDAYSRKVLNALIEYRFTLNGDAVLEVFHAHHPQYFDQEILRLKGGESFLDGGGFDGETTEYFINEVGGNFSRVWYFEPDPNSMEKSKMRLSAYSDKIEYIQAGLYSKDAELGFNLTGNTSGFISENAEFKIKVKNIDSVVQGKIDLIKFDIEGAEIEALDGAKNKIKSDKPKLMISVYHEGSHLWKIPEKILEIYPHYDLYLRHYSQTGLETVCFAIPR